MKTPRSVMLAVVCSALVLGSFATTADKPAAVTRAFVDGTGHGWKELGSEDFENVNCDKDTWTWQKDGLLRCTGTPVGVCKTRKQYTNFEIVLQWRHNKSAGNSGVFLWTPEAALAKLKKPGLPSGIEVQVLDHGFAENFEKKNKKKGDWFTTHGDVFPVGSSKMKPFPPTSPNGSRSFPRKNLSKGVGEWNHYYIRAINGEVRLWVNGEEVSGGNEIEPRKGFVCLESEGSPIDFKDIRIRELP